MIIRKLNLTSFRNYDGLEVTFEPGLNFILGKNGSGKTNIVEAINFLSISHSFRTDEDNDLINNNNDFARVEGIFEIGEETHRIKTILSHDGKKIECDGHKVERLSELTKLINVIVFKPSDVLFFDNSPGTRRRFMDSSISKMDYTYLKALNEYEKLLKERNEILKLSCVDETYLDIVTDQMINVQKQIVLKRQSFIDKINSVINKVICNLKGTDEKVEFIYYPFVNVDDKYLETSKNAYKEALESDLKRRSTSVGVHRENFATTLNKCEITSFGSQGEKRIVALALLLCPYFLVEDKEKKPIVILDDVLSELDKANQNRLINFVSKMEQVFITATNYEDRNVNAYYVSNHKVTRR